MVAVVLNESTLDPLVIGDNTSHKTYHSANRRDAEALAQSLIGQGHSIDMGLAQINSRTARSIGLAVSDAFDPCASMAAAGRLMVSAYRRVSVQAPTVQHALVATLSTYNTGNRVRGIENGYVARVYRAAARATALQPAPAMTAVSLNLQRSAPPGGEATVADEMPETPTRPEPWVVFGAAATSADVFAAPPKGR